jgi:hypothetical protein
MLSRAGGTCALLLLALSYAPLGAQTAWADTTSSLLTGQVTGRFHDEVHALPFAMVEAAAGTVRMRVLTDASGRYVAADLPSGEVTVLVTHAGYEPLSLVVVLPERGSVEVDLELVANPVRLTPLDVRADSRLGPRGEAETEGSLSELEMQTLEVGPGLGQAGIVDVLASLPGNDPGEATDVLFMRGSTADMKLVLLDGVPVYTPFHVAGLLRSFEPTVIDRAELHVGGAPARYDGGLSHILELSTRSARRDALHFSGSVDLLSGSGAVEVPLGTRAGLVGAARSLHDLGTSPLGRDRPYGYRDALVSVDLDPTEGHELRATGFWNRESVALDLGPAPDDARWSNLAGSVAYRSDLGGPDLELTAGLSGYRATLPIQPGARPGELAPPAVLATAETDRARVVGEVLWGSAAAPVRAGVSFEHIDASFAARVLGGLGGADSRGAISAAGTFVDATRPLGPGLSLRAGLRVDHFFGRTTRLAPRASLRWAVAPEVLLTIAAGRYHQPTRTPETDVGQTLAEVAEGELPPAELLPIATADHVVMSLDQSLGTSARLGLQGFWKSFAGLPGVVATTVRSSGVDVRVLSGSERAAAWLGYGLSWYWSRSHLSGRATDFAGRHLLSAGVSGSIGGPLRGEARVAFGSGLPYTSIPVGYAADAASAPNAIVSEDTARAEDAPLSTFTAELDQSFLRLDAELYAVLEPKWGDREWRVRPYLRLLNALDRRDALFYAFERWRSDAVRPIAELPLLPLIGVAVSF